MTAPYHITGHSEAPATPYHRRKKEKTQGMALGLDLRERGPGDPRRRARSVALACDGLTSALARPKSIIAC